jgi:hypothetical protein
MSRKSARAESARVNCGTVQAPRLQFTRAQPIAEDRAAPASEVSPTRKYDMVTRLRNLSVRIRGACLSLCWAVGVAGAAQAGALNIAFTDAAGAPLADAVALLEAASGKVAVKPMADAEISQAKRQFAPRVTLITTGTRVSFPNFDTVRHHVYSFSPIKTFELKLYAGVPGAPA